MGQTLQNLLDEYGESHKNALNKTIHWICVPLIFFSIVALIYSIPSGLLTGILGESIVANWATLTLVVVLIYYVRLSPNIAVGMLIFGAVYLFACHWLVTTFSTPLWLIAVVIFVLAWIGQFYGHKVEGKKPSFLKDLQFLLIGPAWLMHFLYKKLGVRY
tara:strand:- start:5933 stop:6412 length:480 start_codon:yes stop_codon:yes gene_type:complete